MIKPTGFHVRHDLQPTLTYELLTLFLSRPDAQTEQDLQQSAKVHGFRLRGRKGYEKLLKSLVELGIISENKAFYSLTPMGRSISHIVQYQRDLLADFIHFFYYSSFDLHPEKRFSWSYRQVCDTLWLTAPSIVNRDRLVNYVTREAASTFGVNGISFSISSVAGIVNWLEALDPTCITTMDSVQHFIRREYCSVELFALALNHLYQQKKDPTLIHISISDEFRDDVSKLCLLAPERFAEMLALTENSFSCIDVRRERGDRISMAKFDWSILEN